MISFWLFLKKYLILKDKGMKKYDERENRSIN